MQQQAVFQHIFNRTGQGQENKSFLLQETEKYPYFGLAQYYLLKNAAFHETDYNAIAAKTSLFFNTTHQLNALLNPAEINTELTNEGNNPISKTESLAANEITTQDEVEMGEPDLAAPVGEDPLETKLVSDEVIVEKIEALKKTIVQHNEEILFEPLHATDYFASQGIRLSEAQLADDKLGMQLKSFTSWLKTMKKVHADKLPATNVIVEKAIQTQAEKSNKEAEIYTEAMAEAYIVQGKLGKAIEVYSKLSLMIPSKSTYFASKIDSLK